MTGFTTVAYIAAAVLFILSLAGLSKQESAKRGNLFGIIGMSIALVATLIPKCMANFGCCWQWRLVRSSVCNARKKSR